MATTYLTRTPSSTGNNTTATFSAWLKKDFNGNYEGIFTSFYETGEYFEINFEVNDCLEVRCKVSSSFVLRKITNRVFRDNSSFYHIVVAIDTTDATAEDRCKIYVNGVRETSFSTNTNPSQNQNLYINTSSHTHRVGRDEWTTPAYYDGIMSHVIWTDGTAYSPTSFGETHTNGQWKFKAAAGLSYGTNGFYILKDSNSVTDQSGNGNNFTVSGGTLTSTKSSPDNVFCTLNYQGVRAANFTLANGNTSATYTSSDWETLEGTIGSNSG